MYTKQVSENSYPEADGENSKAKQRGLIVNSIQLSRMVVFYIHSYFLQKGTQQINVQVEAGGRVGGGVVLLYHSSGQ